MTSKETELDPGDGETGDRAGIDAQACGSEATNPNVWDQAQQGELPLDEGHALIVDVDGFEGPLDLLLALARTQKVDLSRISILALAEQYLTFIDELKEKRIEVAADYLVMAAWLAFLKSRLLLPREEEAEQELSAEEMAQRLAFRLKRLDAMREAAAKLMTRNRLGRDVFERGMREKVETVKETIYSAEIYDILKAYADQRRRQVKHVHVVQRRKVWSIKDARHRLHRFVGVDKKSWTQLDRFIEQYLDEPEDVRSLIASSFGASLEMAREGLVELRQSAPFEPLFVRGKAQGDMLRAIE